MAEAPKKRAGKPAAKRPADAPPVEKTRVVVPKDAYDARKDEVKAPFKEHGLKWTFLGEGKGLYKKEGVNVFVQFQDDGVHYSLWGDDRTTLEAILASWTALFGRSFVQEAQAAGAEAERKEVASEGSEALRLWRMQEPKARPGEPDLFFKKRLADWNAKRPS